MMIRPTQSTPLIAALEQLGPHDHLCSIYESQQEHFAVAISFYESDSTVGRNAFTSPAMARLATFAKPCRPKELT